MGKQGRRLACLARDGDVAGVKAILNTILCPTFVDDVRVAGRSALHHASSAGHAHIVQLLLRSGANKELPSNHFWDRGRHALHLAAFGGHTEVVKILLQAGADAEACDSDGWQAVHISAARGHLRVLSQLEEAGASLGSQNHHLSTPLHLAAAHGQRSVVLWLLQCCPSSLTVGDYLHRIPKQVSKSNHVGHILEKIATCPADYLRNILERRKKMLIENGKWAIYYARKNRENTVVKWLLKYPDLLHYQDEAGWTLLHHAAYSDSLAVIKVLLFLGALRCARTFRGQTPVDIARRKGHSQQTIKALEFTAQDLKDTATLKMYQRMLLEVGGASPKKGGASSQARGDIAELEAVTRMKRRQLCDSFNNLTDTCLLQVREALEKGAPVECPKGGVALTQMALRRKDARMLSLLLAAGASPLAMSTDGDEKGANLLQRAWLSADVPCNTAVYLTVALSNRMNWEMNQIQVNTDNDATLHLAIHYIFKQLNEAAPWKAKWPFQSSSGDSHRENDIFLRAARWDATASAIFLLAAGAQVDYQDVELQTAAHVAIRAGNLDTARILLTILGGNAFLVDTAGRSPLDLAPPLLWDAVAQFCALREYRILESTLRKAPSQQRYQMQCVVLLFASMYTQLRANRNGSSDNIWHTLYSSLIEVLDRSLAAEQCPKSAGDTDGWLENFLWTLCEENGVVCDSLQEETHVGDELYFESLLEMLKGDKFDWKGKTSQEREIKAVTKLALTISCAEGLPMLLHLLLSVGKTDPDTPLENMTGARSLHVAAIHGHAGIMRYLLRFAANVCAKDASHRTCGHYAFLLGHKVVGDFLIQELPDMTRVKDLAGRRPRDLQKGFDRYLTLYQLDDLPSKDMQMAPSDAVRQHLELQRPAWEEGIKNAIKHINVDYGKGEAAEIQDKVKIAVQEIMQTASLSDKNYKGMIREVGSGAENVQIYCPDRFSFILVLGADSGVAEGDVSVDMKRFSSMDSQRCFLSLRTEAEDTRIQLEETFFSDKLLDAVRSSLECHCFEDKRLSLIPCSLRKYGSGVAMTLAWEGKVYPLLLIRVSVVPVLPVAWPCDLPRPRLTPGGVNAVHLTSRGREWVFSFDLLEAQIISSLCPKKRSVIQACIALLSSLKVEKWAPRTIRDKFSFRDAFEPPADSSSSMQTLRSSLLRELEELENPHAWSEAYSVERAKSVFMRMCTNVVEVEEYGKEILEPMEVPPYFGSICRMPTSSWEAPFIMDFLASIEPGPS
ncbi:ankyrin-2-like [Penaeus indicus]|uniref:ankyrin-2-like n=1 Tax=Penaeus indicus TaxID=29960 RepID=UPI00300C4D18